MIPIAGLILTPSPCQDRGLSSKVCMDKNDTQHEREGNDHKINSQRTQHIREQHEKVFEIRTGKQAEQEKDQSLINNDTGSGK